MKFKIQVVIEGEEEGNPAIIMEEVACFESKEKLSLETLGFSLAEAKQMLGAIQKKLTQAQVKEYLAEQRVCQHCGKVLKGKANKSISFRTLFGKLELDSPRFYSCKCQPVVQKSFSPLTTLLAERTAPEFVYLQTKWVALMSYGMTANLLEEILPLDKPVSTAVLSRRVKQVAERLENELGEEQFIYIEGCQLDWEALPPPAAPLTVGIDGGYVRGREGDNRKAGNFEVIVGKSMPEEGPNKRFGFVNGYDTKPKRRLFELLKGQGMQFNQSITFLSDGGDTVTALPQS